MRPTSQDRLPGERPSRLGARFVVGLVLAVVVASGLALFGDLQLLRNAFRSFTWWLLLPALGLTLWTYAVRFLKWQLYLRQLGVDGPPTGVSLLVFLSAFAMTITPGKVGEVIKCVYLRRLTGTPLSRSTAIVVAERLTDGLAMLVLAGVGVSQFAAGRAILAAAAVIAGGGVLALQRPGRLAMVLDRLPSLPVVGRVGGYSASFFESSGTLLRPGPLICGSALGVVAWFGESVAFFLILIGLDLPASGHLLVVSTFVLAVSSLAGALSLLPAGLGVADASVAGMLLVLLPGEAMDRGVAAAATLLLRFATLWFAVMLGVVALVLLRRFVAEFEDAPRTDHGGVISPSGDHPEEIRAPDPVAPQRGGYR